MPVDRTTQGTLVVATVTAVWLGIVAVAALDRAPWEDARRRRRASGRRYRTAGEAEVREALARTTAAQPAAAGTVTVTGNRVG